MPMLNRRDYNNPNTVTAAICSLVIFASIFVWMIHSELTYDPGNSQAETLQFEGENFPGSAEETCLEIDCSCGCTEECDRDEKLCRPPT